MENKRQYIGGKRIDPKDESKIYFVSDSHFGHRRISTFCPMSRAQGLSIEEQDEILIKRWNEIIPEDAIVFHLGDVTFWRDINKIKNILRRLNGTIHLILGNHDELIIENWDALIEEGYFATIQTTYDIRLSGILVSMCHYPKAVWESNHHGAFNLFGHCHGTYKAVGKQMDVGWDTWDLGAPFKDHTPGPISWEEVKKCLNARDIVAQDNHKPGRGNM